MFSYSNDAFPTALQVLINKGDGTFQDETTTLNPSMSLNTDELDYNPQFVDLDHSGINAYLFASSAQSASRQSNYLLLNDGTGHLYVALHDQFQALNTVVQNDVSANYTSANGYFVNTAQFAKFVAAPQADGSVNYVATYAISHANPDGSFATQYVFVNVPLDYNPTTDFTQDVTISDRNGSTLIRTWAGNDTFHDTDAGASTHIDGGLGANTSVYSGVMADYTLSADANGVHVTSKSGMAVPAVADTLVNVQTLQFSDGSVTDTKDSSGVYSLNTPASTSSAPTSATITGTTVVTQSVVTSGVETSSTLGTGTITFDGGAVQAGANNLTFANAAAINAAGGAFDVNGNTLTWNGAISDGSGTPAGGLTVTDTSSGTPGALVLGGANTYSGGTTLGAGTLEVTNSAVVGGAETASSIGTGILTFNGGTLKAGANHLVFANGAMVKSGGGTFDLNGNTLTWNGAVSSLWWNTGALTITDSSSGPEGTLVLNGMNNLAGGVTLSGAILAVGSESSLGSGALTFNGGTLRDQTGYMSFNNAVLVNASGGAIDGDGHYLQFTGTISDGSGPGALRITDSSNGGVVALSAANTYSGGTIVNATVAVNNSSVSNGAEMSSSLGIGSLTLDGGTVAFNSNLTFANAAKITANGGAFDIGSVTGTWSGIISNGSGGPAGVLTLQDHGGYAGKAILQGANTYSGGTTVGSGIVLQVTNAATNGTETASSIGTGALTFNGGALQAGVSALSFNNAAAINAAGGAFDVAGNTLTWTGAISDGLGTPSGGLTITDTSSGTKGSLVLDATNTYTGGTTVTGGATVNLVHDDGNGNLDDLGTGPISLSDGAVLLNGDVNATAATLNNALSIGSGGGVLAAEDQDYLYINRSLTGSGHLTLTGDGYISFGSPDAGYYGTVLITGGVSIRPQPNNTLPSHADIQLDAGSSLLFANGSNLNAPILMETIGSLADGPSGGGVVGDKTNVNAVLTVGDTLNTTFSGLIKDHTNGQTGVLSLVKQGADVFTAAGASTYFRRHDHHRRVLGAAARHERVLRRHRLGGGGDGGDPFRRRRRRPAGGPCGAELRRSGLRRHRFFRRSVHRGLRRRHNRHRRL